MKKTIIFILTVSLFFSISNSAAYSVYLPGLHGSYLQTIQINRYDYVLKDLGYYKEESKDSKLNLRNAILRFQSDHNMPVNGIWNDEALAVLKRRLFGELYQYKDSITSPPTDKEWIVINKTKRSLTLYKNNTVIKKFPIAIGKYAAYTPDGKFYVVNKLENPGWKGGGYAKPVRGGAPNNPLGKRWIGISLKGGTRYGIHGNADPYSIGKNISRGCVRMINSDVEEFFELVPIKADIWIGTEDLLKKWGVTQDGY